MRLLITAGPTREAIDPVRFLSNRSSGKMGYALAAAAAARGHEVALISGPVRLDFPPGVRETALVESAREMYDAVQMRLGGCDAAIFCAAVADYRPVEISERKIKKTGDRLTLELERTEDILGSARSVFGFSGVLVGFAAETDDLETHAWEKLKKKDCDLLVANDVSRPGIGFDSDRNAVTLFFADGRREALSERPKSEIAQIVVEFVESLVEGRRHHVRPS